MLDTGCWIKTPINKHDKNKTTESDPVDLKQVVEEIIDFIIG